MPSPFDDKIFCVTEIDDLQTFLLARAALRETVTRLNRSDELQWRAVTDVGPQSESSLPLLVNHARWLYSAEFSRPARERYPPRTAPRKGCRERRFPTQHDGTHAPMDADSAAMPVGAIWPRCVALQRCSALLTLSWVAVFCCHDKVARLKMQVVPISAPVGSTERVTIDRAWCFVEG